MLSAVPRIVLAFWGREISATFFLCPHDAGDLSDGSFLGRREVRERLLVTKCLSELQFIHFNAHLQMLHVT